MNLTQIIVYKHQDQQSFVCFFIQKHNVHTCIVELSPDRLIIKYFMTLCMFELFPGLKKVMIFLSDYFFNRIFFVWYIDIYIDVDIYKLFQMCSIQIDLGTCLHRGYIVFAYIKTMSTRHHPPCSCIMYLGKESMLFVCGCSSANYCLLRGWISTYPGLCVF